MNDPETFRSGDLILIERGANLHTEGSPRPMTWKTVRFQPRTQVAFVIARHSSGPIVDERGDELVVLTLDGGIFYVHSGFVAHASDFNVAVLTYANRQG